MNLHGYLQRKYFDTTHYFILWEQMNVVMIVMQLLDYPLEIESST